MTRAMYVQTNIDNLESMLTYRILIEVWLIFVESFRLSSKTQSEKINMTRMTS